MLRGVARGGGGASGITIGTTTITGGATTEVLYNLAGSALTGSFTIKRGEAMTVRLRGEFLTKKVIPFNYIRTVYPMIHDDDRMDLSREAIVAVLSFSEAYLAKPLGKDHWTTRLNEAQGRLSAAQALAKPVNPAYSQFSPFIPRGNGR